MKLYVSHDKKGRWEIIEPQDGGFVLAKIEAGRRLRSGVAVYELEVQEGDYQRSEANRIVKLEPGK